LKKSVKVLTPISVETNKFTEITAITIITTLVLELFYSTAIYYLHTECGFRHTVMAITLAIMEEDTRISASTTTIVKLKVIPKTQALASIKALIKRPASNLLTQVKVLAISKLLSKNQLKHKKAFKNAIHPK
jgi:hypothetical protein